ncbi:MAG: Acyl-CoA dehydrogenase [uncultured Paraburkholderia sp.]|nr:MAG: Acyl-CoA dehydrogenase [uncultured Paraburkholderia sp.]
MAARCAGYFLHAQIESGSLCPLTMTFASIPVLQREPQLFDTLRDKLVRSTRASTIRATCRLRTRLPR